MRTARIDLTKIPKDAIYHGKKGKYIDVVIWDKETPDQYGYDVSVQMSVSKEDKDNGIKGAYIGNGKIRKRQNTQNTPAISHAVSDPNYGDLPF